MGFLNDPRSIRRCLLAICVGSFLLVFHNYGLNIFPRLYLAMDPAAMRLDPGGSGLTYTYPFDRSVSDGPYSVRSRTIIYEDDIPQVIHLEASIVRAVGSSNWTHEPGQIIFSAFNNSDPRTNGRSYFLSYPRFYTSAIGRTSLLIFAASVAGLYLLGAPKKFSPTVPAGPARSGNWRLHLCGASALFLAGLYLSTGTLTPYANTTIPHAARASGYLYNPDHIHFKALFDFVDGKDRSTWNNALLLRRILYNVLAYPFMKAAGWEVGGTLASIVFNLAAFIVFVRTLRRRIGERGAVFAAWTLALYPGAGYWAGLPYLYALIVPGCLLIMLALIAMADDHGWRPVIAGSLLMGVANLGYEFFVFFLPATLLLLAWRRRWLAAVVSAILQLAPVAVWAFMLQHHFGQNLANSNSNSFGAIAGAYFHVHDFARWRTVVATVPDIGPDLFFGANFIFLPTLFLVVLVLNAVTSRIRPHPAEVALLAAGLAFFLFNNLAPDYSAQWQLRGSWIARLYQPVFPALVLFCARWYQHLPPVGRLMRITVFTTCGLTALGNALVISGPLLMNPLRLSETAFYRFYDHANHLNYESNLRIYGRRPLGFPRRSQ